MSNNTVFCDFLGRFLLIIYLIAGFYRVRIYRASCGLYGAVPGFDKAHYWYLTVVISSSPVLTAAVKGSQQRTCKLRQGPPTLVGALWEPHM